MLLIIILILIGVITYTLSLNSSTFSCMEEYEETMYKYRLYKEGVE